MIRGCAKIGVKLKIVMLRAQLKMIWLKVRKQSQ